VGTAPIEAARLAGALPVAGAVPVPAIPVACGVESRGPAAVLLAFVEPAEVPDRVLVPGVLVAVLVVRSGGFEVQPASTTAAMVVTTIRAVRGRENVGLLLRGDDE